MKPMCKCQKLPLLKWSLEAGFKCNSIPIRPLIKMPRFIWQSHSNDSLGLKFCTVKTMSFKVSCVDSTTLILRHVSISEDLDLMWTPSKSWGLVRVKFSTQELRVISLALHIRIGRIGISITSFLTCNANAYSSPSSFTKCLSVRHTWMTSLRQHTCCLVC